MGETPVTTDEVEDRRSPEELRARLDEIQERQEEIDKEFEGRALPSAEKEEFETLQTEKEETERLVSELEERQAWIERSAEKSSGRESGASFHTRRPDHTTGDDIYEVASARFADNPARELRDRAKAVTERMQFPQLGNDWRPGVNREDVQAHIERLIERHDGDDDSPGEVSRLVISTSSPTYRQAFWKQCAGKFLNAEEQRALSLGALTGGQAVPVTLDPSVIPTSNSSVNPVRAIARIETLTGSNTWNGVSSGAITAARVAEATAGSDNTPTMAAPTATVTKAHAFVPFSHEVGADWGALEREMGRLFQDAKDDEEAVAFVTGSGAGVNPQGFVTGTTATSPGPAGLGINTASLYALEAALPPRFRPNETFVANRNSYNLIRNIDTSGGAALWLYVSQGLNSQVPTPGNTGALLLGRPAYEASAMDAAPANGDKIVVLGDFNYFLVLDRIGMTVEVIPNLMSGIQPTGQRGLYAYWRNTSKVLSASAFVALTATT